MHELVVNNAVASQFVSQKWHNKIVAKSRKNVKLALAIFLVVVVCVCVCGGGGVLCSDRSSDYWILTFVTSFWKCKLANLAWKNNALIKSISFYQYPFDLSQCACSRLTFATVWRKFAKRSPDPGRAAVHQLLLCEVKQILKKPNRKTVIHLPISQRCL